MPRLSAEIEQLSWWPSLGFRTNPYDTRPLSGDEDGRDLLVGRDKAVSEITAHLRARGMHLTVDAPNGGGKTSLVQCAFGGLRSTLSTYVAGQLLVPMMDLIDPAPEESPGEFIERVFLKLASTLVENRDLINRSGGSLDRHLSDLDRLIKDPLLRSTGAGFGLTPASIAGSRTVSANSSSSFHRVGIEHLVRKCLKEAFPADESGGIVACIDNTEVLGSPGKVRALLDAVRDRLLRLRGVKWIVLGANGTLDGLGNHPRLSGVLTKPMRLSELDGEQAGEVVERRIGLYRFGSRVTVPVNGQGFQRIYETCGRDLRTALGLCEAFAVEADGLGLLTGDALSVEPGGDGMRAELPVWRIEDFLEAYSLQAWDEIVAMGKEASSILQEVHDAGAVTKRELRAESRTRRTAVKRLRSSSFIVGGRSQHDRRQVELRLSAEGALAITGSHLARGS